MNPEPEIRRLLDLMPASGRMVTKIVPQPRRSQVIETPFPWPWDRRARPIYINFNLWRRLSRPQRDLLLLEAVSWLLGIEWFKPGIYQGVLLAGVVGGTVEIVQGDAVGVLVAGGLSVLAGRQIWQDARSVRTQLDSDEAAIEVARQRGYSSEEAAKHLRSAIEAVAEMEGRSSLDFSELVRAQHLKRLAQQSPVSVPERVKQE